MLRVGFGNSFFGDASIIVTACAGCWCWGCSGTVVVFGSLVARVAMRFAVAAVVVFGGVVDSVIWFFWVVELSRWRLALEAMMDSVARKLGLRWRLAPARVVVIPGMLLVQD